MARIITGKLQLHLEVVDLAQLAAAALETVRPAADAKGLHLEAVVEPALPMFSGDVQRLQQVFWNLLSNAVRFTDAGGRVRVQIESEPRAIHITVSDTGAGIPPAILPFVFDRFTQADSSSTQGRGPRAWSRDCPSHRRAARRHGVGGKRRGRPGRDISRLAAGGRMTYLSFELSYSRHDGQPLAAIGIEEVL